MAISYTYHGELVPGQGGTPVPGLRKPRAVRVDVEDGAASDALTERGWYRITGAGPSYVLIDAAAANGAGGEFLADGGELVRWIEAGDKIGSSAA